MTTPAPDELRAFIGGAKTHSSKRIQVQAGKVTDAISRLRELIAEDHQRNAEKRRLERERAEQKAEVEKLERALAEAKAKLRGTPASTSDDGPSAAEIRTWAATAGVDCTTVGRIPATVREQYDAAHPAA